MLGLFSYAFIGSASAQVPDPGTVQDTVEDVVAPVQDTVEPVQETVDEVVEQAPVQEAVEPIQEAVEPIQEAVEDAVDGGQDVVDGAGGAIEGPATDVQDEAVGDSGPQEAAGGSGAGETVGAGRGSSEGTGGRIRDDGGREDNARAGTSLGRVMSILTGPREQQPPREDGDDLSELIATGESIGGTFNAEDEGEPGGAGDMFSLPTTGAEVRALLVLALMLCGLGFALWRKAAPNGPIR
jgi:hypothetical protein